MNEPAKNIRWMVWGALGLTLAALAAAFAVTQTQDRAARKLLLPESFPVADFTLTNQAGQAVSLAGLKGSVWVADIIFTRCGTICPGMTRQMSALQSALPARGVMLVSLTTDPEFDTPPVLKRYGEEYGALPDRWLFLTGTKLQIVGAAVDGLKLIAVEKEPDKRESPADLFIHSPMFVVVDKQGRVRAAFDSNEPGLKEKTVKAVRFLLREK